MHNSITRIANKALAKYTRYVHKTIEMANPCSNLSIETNPPPWLRATRKQNRHITKAEVRKIVIWRELEVDSFESHFLRVL